TSRGSTCHRFVACFYSGRKMSRYLSACCISLVLAFCAAAQTPDTATIAGKITDPSKAPVGGVQITVRNAQNNLQRTVTTRPSGAYSIEGLPITGRYEITASKEGFAEATVKDIELQGGATAAIDLQLNVAGNATRVTVTGVTGE